MTNGDLNILANVAVPHQEGANFATMFELQLNLQTRLNQLPGPLPDYKHMATKSIYWGHCIRAELVELMEWLSQMDDPTWKKELQMEAIDVVHFVFNIGIEAFAPIECLHDMELQFEHMTYDTIDPDRVRAAATCLETTVVSFVNLLPWKSWKAYKDFTTIDGDILRQAYQNVFYACLILCNVCGLDRSAIVNMYYAKNKVNHVRQDNGY